MTQLMTRSEAQSLEGHEAIIRQGLNTFLEVGTALSAIRDGKLYRNSYSTFEQYCSERWGLSKTHTNRIIGASVVVENLTVAVENLTPIGVILPETESQARPLTTLEPAQQVEAWAEAVETAPKGKVTAAHVSKVVEKYKPAPVQKVAPKPEPEHKPAPPLARPEPTPEPMAVHYSSESSEWNTPKNIVERSKDVLKEIDVDPCSNSRRNPNVPARTHYTKDDDGLSRIWEGTVFMNPPYGDEIIDWVERLVGLYRSGVVTSAIALLPARTDTQWFSLLCSGKPLLCFLRGRLKFSNSQNSAPFPSLVAYFGNDPDRFLRDFCSIGLVFSGMELKF